MKYPLLICIFFLSLQATASQLQTIDNIRVNPKDNADYQVSATINLVWAKRIVDPVTKLEAQEMVIIALKSMGLSDITAEDSIEKIQSSLLSQAKQNAPYMQLKDVVVTELLVQRQCEVVSTSDDIDTP